MMKMMMMMMFYSFKTDIESEIKRVRMILVNASQNDNKCQMATFSNNVLCNKKTRYLHSISFRLLWNNFPVRKVAKEEVGCCWCCLIQFFAVNMPSKCQLHNDFIVLVSKVGHGINHITSGVLIMVEDRDIWCGREMNTGIKRCVCRVDFFFFFFRI